MSKIDESIFYPGINTYLEQIDNKDAVTCKELEDLVNLIQVKTGLSQLESETIVASFFQEVRNIMLNGDIVCLIEIGKFLIASPSNSPNKIRVFPKFKMFKTILNKINGIITKKRL